MKTKTITIITVLMLSIMFLAANAFADIPAPPVNQKLGMPDTVMNDLVEAECRACHDQQGFARDSNVDRHHLLYGTDIIYGECANDTLDPPCLTDEDCAELDYCRGQTVASDPLASPGVYGCMSCHEESTVGGVTNFLVERDCLVCHLQVPNEASVHHLTGTAQGTNSPLGDPNIGDCTPCHGTTVDDFGDNATIPTYAPSMVTPTVREGTADEQNLEGARAGGCNYCHTSGTGSSAPGVDDEFGVDVYKNGTLHHTAGVNQDKYGNEVNGGCELCHGNPLNFGGDTLALRNCEQCHGMESLHNIQADSDECDGVVVGGELYGYGHIGADNPGTGSDCWGCHGFGFASAAAPGSGPTIPHISSLSDQAILAGTDATITLRGNSFTNTAGGVEYSSNILLTPQAGAVIELIPNPISSCSLTIVIPGTTAPGNYLLTAVKDGGAVISNPLSIIIKQPVIIETATIGASCGTPCGKMTITGSGFGDTPPAGSEEFINVTQNGIKLTILTWTDTQITATGAVCDGSPITVNGLFDSATK